MAAAAAAAVMIRPFPVVPKVMLADFGAALDAAAAGGGGGGGEPEGFVVAANRAMVNTTDGTRLWVRRGGAADGLPPEVVAAKGEA